MSVFVLEIEISGPINSSASHHLLIPIPGIFAYDKCRKVPSYERACRSNSGTKKGISLTQAQVAEMLLCDVPLLSMWENRKRNIPASRYEELSHALKMPFDQIRELAKENHIMKIEFNKKFCALETAQDAMDFIEYTLNSFEVDADRSISLKALLRNYLYLELILTMLEKDAYQKQEGEDFEWDYTWFQANVETNTMIALFQQKHRDLYEKVIHIGCESLLQIAGGRTIEILQELLADPDPEFLRIFRIHLLEYCHHLDDLATGTAVAKNRFYCAKYTED